MRDVGQSAHPAPAPAAAPAPAPVRAAASVPALSVVVVVFAGGGAIGRTLDALVRQDVKPDDPPLEVIVVVAQGCDDEQPTRGLPPSTRWIVGPRAAHPARLRALGVRAATAPIVACTEDHCVPARDWGRRIVAAHAQDAVAIGGAIDKATPDSAVAWAAFLLEYGRYMPPITSGSAIALSDCNVSYKRSALAAIEDVWREVFHETSVHAALLERGGSLARDASIVVTQSRRPEMGPFLAERFAHGRVFARIRAARQQPPRRVAQGLAALAVAPLLVARALRQAWRRPDARASALRAIPQLVLAASAWSLGEAVGALAPRSAA